MCRTGLLRSRWVNGAPVFQSENSSEIICRFAATKPEYIEHVFPYICLPEGIRSKSIRVYQRHAETRRKWSLASINNSLLIFNVVKHLEEEEKKLGYEWKWKISDNIKSNHRALTKLAVDHFDSKNSDSFQKDIVSNFERLFQK